MITGAHEIADYIRKTAAGNSSLHYAIAIGHIDVIHTTTYLTADERLAAIGEVLAALRLIEQDA